MTEMKNKALFSPMGVAGLEEGPENSAPSQKEAGKHIKEKEQNALPVGNTNRAQTWEGGGGGTSD